MKLSNLRKFICSVSIVAVLTMANIPVNTEPDVFSGNFVKVYGNVVRAESQLTRKGYQLEEVVMFSRHNLRSPLTTTGSMATQATPHTWFRWTAPQGHLSVHGAMAETTMGIYYRQYLEDEKFIPADWLPPAGQVRFYANSFQRTIATARHFSSGMLPVANVQVERRLDMDERDPVFLPPYKPNDRLFRLTEQDLGKMFDGRGLAGFQQKAAAYIPSEEKLLNFRASAYAREHGIVHLNLSDVRPVFNENCELPLSFTGAACKSTGVCDALIMQYYEVPDDVQAAWGNTAVTHADWENIGRLHALANSAFWDNYHNALLQSRNLLRELRAELTNSNRKFSFLCGHDTNIACILRVLKAEAYELPDTINIKTPLGGKIVLEKRRGRDGVDYLAVNLVYETDKQLRNIEPLSLDNPPNKYPLRFQDLEPNDDGLYRYADFLKLLDTTIAAAAEFE